MDIMSMLASAQVTDMDGNELGDVVAIHIVGGKLLLTIDFDIEDFEVDDPDGGQEVDDDEDEHELDNTEEVPRPIPLRAVGGTGG